MGNLEEHQKGVIQGLWDENKEEVAESARQGEGERERGREGERERGGREGRERVCVYRELSVEKNNKGANHDALTEWCLLSDPSQKDG